MRMRTGKMRATGSGTSSCLVVRRKIFLRLLLLRWWGTAGVSLWGFGVVALAMELAGPLTPGRTAHGADAVKLSDMPDSAAGDSLRVVADDTKNSFFSPRHVSSDNFDRQVVGGTRADSKGALEVGNQAIWTNQLGGSWIDELNWLDSHAPGPGDDVVIQAERGLTVEPTSVTVDGPNSPVQIQSLRLGSEQADSANLILSPSADLFIGQTLTIHPASKVTGAHQRFNARDFSGVSSVLPPFTDDFLATDFNTTQSGDDVDMVMGGWMRLEGTVLSQYLMGFGAFNLDEASYALVAQNDGAPYVSFIVTPDGVYSSFIDVSFQLEIFTWYFVLAYHDAANDEIGIRINNCPELTASLPYTDGLFDGGIEGSGFVLGASARTAWGVPQPVEGLDGQLARAFTAKPTVPALEVVDAIEDAFWNDGNGATWDEITNKIEPAELLEWGFGAGRGTYYNLTESSGPALDSVSGIDLDEHGSVPLVQSIPGRAHLEASGGITNQGVIALGDQELSLLGGDLTNAGRLQGSGSIDNLLLNLPGGEVHVTAGEQMHFTAAGVQSNAGRIVALGNATQSADIEFQGKLTNVVSTGYLRASHATLRFHGGLRNESSLTVSTGTVSGDVENQVGAMIVVVNNGDAKFEGDLHNEGRVLVTPNSTATYFGKVSGSGSFPGGGTHVFTAELAPGPGPDQIGFDGDVVFGDQATLEAELKSTTPGSGHDQVTIAGSATLDGTLALKPFPEYTDPTTQGVSDGFVVLTAGTRSGTFASVQYGGTTLPASFGSDGNGSFRSHQGGGLFRNITYTSTEVEFQNLLALRGDADGDHDVDLLDYQFLSDHFDPTGVDGPHSWLHGDFDGDHDVDLVDYSAFAGNFSPAGYGVVSTVPEPSGVSLGILGLCGVLGLVSRCPGLQQRQVVLFLASPFENQQKEGEEPAWWNINEKGTWKRFQVPWRRSLSRGNGESRRSASVVVGPFRGLLAVSPKPNGCENLQN